ncbi:hypothetical protein M8009_02845 [Halomonas sp. ATCH28]|uniref:ABC transmembrane type-1 domain-containing protein n=1 Tax=Halomonas gemina TaxID=2945105 RepID=A0ABT0SXA6_9GAMM|nr:hypothetical protein [Halomonas gemina]MCL7939242.1 hypothetical protein [Halomonas gemina]
MLNKVFTWVMRLLWKFITASPVMALITTLSALIAKVSMILAFLVPMKVIILLSSETTPTYFIPIVNKIGWDALVIGLGVISGLLFVVHVISSKVSEVYTLVGYRSLERKSAKLVLFEGQDDFLHGSYKRISSMLSSIVFLLLSSFFFSVFYKEILLLFFVIIATFLLYIINITRIEERGFLPASELGNVLNITQGLAFFGVFSYVLVDFLYLHPPDFIVALVSIIAFRIILGNVSSVARDIHFFIGNKNKMDAVYFHDKIFVERERKGSDGVWYLLENRSIDSWAPDILKEATGTSWQRYHVQWRQSGIPDVLFLVVKNLSSNNYCFVKIYHKKHKKKAQHEASLLLNSSVNLPAPKLLLTTYLGGHHIHVMDFGEIDVFSTKPAIPPRDIQLNLMGVTLPDEIVDQYRRSHPLASSLLRDTDFSRLKLSIGSQETGKLTELLDSYSGMCNLMNQMPLMLSAPVKKEWLVKGYEDTFLLLEWGEWKLEQGAAGWPAKENHLAELSEKFSTLTEERSVFQNVSVEEIQFSCLFHEFCRAMKSQRYADVVNGLPMLLDMYKKACHSKKVGMHVS